ncbi:MAG: PEP-CTERM sorting domain-containing protein [Planctomycetota bacterium]
MKRRLITLTVLLGMSISSAHGSILDQSQEQTDICTVICSDWAMAQTFTAGVSGKLAQVDLYLENHFVSFPIEPGAASYPITVSIVSIEDSMPTWSVLSVFFEADTQYAIVVTNDDIERYDADSTQWGIKGTDVFDGGAMWVWMETTGWVQSVQPPDESLPLETFYDKDAAFRTYMVPEPSTLLLFCFLTLVFKKQLIR